MSMLLKRIIRPVIEGRIIGSGFSLPPTTLQKFSTQDDAKPATTTNMKIILSDSCVKRLEELCKDGSFLRVIVEGGGCSGFQYKFDIDNKLNDDDLSFGNDKAKVVIDTISLEYCSGATVDYHSELIRSGFRIVGNPKAEQGCSCGTSFAVKLD